MTPHDKRKATMRRLAEEKIYEQVLRAEWEHCRAQEPSIGSWEQQPEFTRKAMITGMTLCITNLRRRAEMRKATHVPPSTSTQ
jgi:hypothetical protein